MPAIQWLDRLGTSNLESEGLKDGTRKMRVYPSTLFREADTGAKLNKAVNVNREATTTANRAGDHSWLVIQELVGVRLYVSKRYGL